MKLITILVFVLGFILMVGIFYFGLSPLKKAIDYCEDVNWDGSSYFWKDTKNIEILYCNKEGAESDAIVQVVNAMYFWEDNK